MKKLQTMFAVLMMSGAVLAPVVATTAFAATAASEQQATQSLVQQLSGIKSLTAQFEQTTKITNPKVVQGNKGLSAQHMNQTFKGEMKVERPGKFYWQTHSPSKQTIVTSGKTVWIYDPDLQQAVRQSLDEQVSNTPALLLSGNTSQIMQAYRVTQPDQSKLYYTLLPRNKEGAFQSLTISFANKSPSLMILQDSLGQTTYIRFSQVKLNPSIASSVFDFTPPKGTDVIDQ
ncbi:outer membrane lipoprotein chaperone LolA [Acinetobacter larvae]|uniref:Outer-membrane lipoprotein carrier protein n=1 Tax=Acinetobacter larvae TaxID=1789224 RepID=A0A1B2LXF1_9GAMM|nr:outer membrane lipoprotein chaperone LolA [Acinetobacter larvae]AOA57628.1 outer membrane lipoprotein carrier protein LolA [Acinetobacter larvae]